MGQKRKIIMMLVALLGAVMLWLYVVTAVAPEAAKSVRNIPINIDGSAVLEQRDLIITDQDYSTLSVELNTSRVNLHKLNAESITVNADASRIKEPGVYALTCNVTFPDTVRASDVDLVRKSVDSVTVTVNRLVEKSVPVSLERIGAVQDGYLLEKAELNPDTITLRGPDFDVDRVVKAVVAFDVSDVQEIVETTLDVTFLDENDEAVEFSSEAVTVSATQIDMRLPVYRTKELTLAVNTVEGGGVKNENAEISIEPQTVLVKGDSEDIDQLDDVYVLDTLELSTLDNENELTYKLLFPGSVSLINDESEAIVKVLLKGVTTDTINVTDIRLINQPEQYKSEAITKSAKVIIRGSTAEIREIKQSENNGIYIEVDMSDYTETGGYSISGKVINPKHPNVGVTESVEIIVVISAVEPELTEGED